MNATVKVKNPLGRLTALGPKEPWQVGLLLPRAWDELHPVVTALGQENLCPLIGTKAVLQGSLVAGSTILHTGKGRRLTFSIADRAGHAIHATIFYPGRDTEASIDGNAHCLSLWGKIGVFNNQIQIENPQVLDPRWVGRLRPRYPAKPKVIGADTVRDRVLAFLKESMAPLEDAWVDFVAGGDRALFATELRHAGVTRRPFRDVLLRAHLPRNVREGQSAQRILERLNAAGVARNAGTTPVDGPRAGFVAPSVYANQADRLPFALTSSQTVAVQDILADMRQTRPMHRLLSGDVGSGKTAVYGVVAAACVRAGGKVAILAPNVPLVAQIATTLNQWWPNLDVLRVTGKKATRSVDDKAVLVGTTALLHRDIGHRDLVIVDEQHKFSRDQRERLRGDGCHLLEVTATCTPRSKALMDLGIRAVSRLENRRTNPERVTRIWREEDKVALMRAIDQTVEEGDQVLVIYPLRGETEASKADADTLRQQATTACKLWEKHYLGRVRLVTGKHRDADKEQAIKDLRENRASLLVATTVVEVGIDLPRLRRVVIIQADRLGLVTLHQIRGRVARTGGRGYCDLYLPGDKDAAKRLEVLCRTQDGFDIAEADLHLRGFGDLSAASEDEKGFRDGLLFHRPVRPEDMEAAIGAQPRPNIR